MNDRRQWGNRMFKEKKTQKKKQVKENLATRLMTLVAASLFILVVFAGLAIRFVGKRTSEKLVEHELNLALFSLNQTFDAISLLDFTYENGCLYKGQTNLTDYPLVLDNFKSNTGVEISIFWGDTSVASSITDADNNRILGVQVPDKVYARVMEGELYYSSNELINGVKYYGVYKPIYLSGGSEPVGILFAGITQTLANNAINRYLVGSLVFMGALIILIGVVMAVYIVILVKSLTKVVSNLDQVSGGELNVIVDNRLMKREDEVGNIARAIGALVGSFSEIVHNIRRTTDSLHSFSGQFSESFNSIAVSINNTETAVAEIAKDAVLQTEETQKVGSQIDEMSKAIERTSQNTEALSVSADNMKNQKEQVDHTLGELIEISAYTRQSIDEVQDKTNVTNQSAKEIRSATETISDIADQTNLLSLNASIEAARAGEAGRGFAVVADEIRSLADQSNVFAERIKKIVDELIRNSNSSVATMQQVCEEINQQSEKLDSTRAVFEELNEEINSVGTAIDSISDDMHLLDMRKDDVGQAVESLALITKRNEEGTGKTSASMLELSNIVNDCREATTQFVKLSEDLAENTAKFKI